MGGHALADTPSATLPSPQMNPAISLDQHTPAFTIHDTSHHVRRSAARPYATESVEGYLTSFVPCPCKRRGTPYAYAPCPLARTDMLFTSTRASPLCTSNPTSPSDHGTQTPACVLVHRGSSNVGAVLSVHPRRECALLADANEVGAPIGFHHVEPAKREIMIRDRTNVSCPRARAPAVAQGNAQERSYSRSSTASIRLPTVLSPVTTSRGPRISKLPHVASPLTRLGYSDNSPPPIQRRFSHRVFAKHTRNHHRPARNDTLSIRSICAQNAHVACKNLTASATPNHATAASFSTAHAAHHDPAARALCHGCAPPHIYKHFALRWPRVLSHPHVTCARLSSHSAPACAILCMRDVGTRRAHSTQSPPSPWCTFAFARESQQAAPTDPAPHRIPLAPQRVASALHFPVHHISPLLYLCPAEFMYPALDLPLSCLLSSMNEFRLFGTLLQVKEHPRWVGRKTAKKGQGPTVGLVGRPSPLTNISSQAPTAVSYRRSDRHECFGLPQEMIEIAISAAYIQIGPPGTPGTSGPDLEWVPWLPPGLFHGPNPSFLDKQAVYNSRLYIFKLVAELWWLLAQAGSWIERGVQEPVCELEDRQ
ncbi:hypothetical protein C8R44DRAFT_859599 [Mycena epipterygia]|nr:hypothetical protein C8R44DRAFT_859599 [Mycena epipterygia]